MNSLKNLNFLTISLFAICFLSFSSIVEAASCAEKVKCPSKNDILLRTDATQQSIDTIDKFWLTFSAAVRTNDLVERASLVHTLEQYLTKPFSITITLVTPVVTYTASDYDSLLLMVTGFNANLDVHFVGNFSVESYSKSCHGLRTLQLQALEYFVQAGTGIAGLTAMLDQYTIVETSCDQFKIQTIVSDAQKTIFMCCPD